MARRRCSSPTTAATIAHAVSVAGSDDDTIQLAAGTYDEAVSVPSALSFVGAGTSGPSTTTIDSTGRSAPALTFTAGGSLSDLVVHDGDSGIGGALNVSGGTVTASAIVVTSDGQTAGTDAISVGGGSFDMTGSTASATNTDADVQNGNGHPVVFDGSGIEVGGGTANVNASTISATEGIALRIHLNAVAVNVRDSVIESSGTESQTSLPGDGWQAIEAAAGALTLTGDTVYNATVGAGQALADALSVEAVNGITTTIHNTILRAQPSGVGFDINASESVSADHSSFTSVNTIGVATTVTSPDDAGNISGDPGLNGPGGGDFSLTAGSPLVGAGDPSALVGGDTDLGGSARATACASQTVLDIGAVEAAAPQCQASAPAVNPGAQSFLYASTASSFEQYAIGSGDALSPLSPASISAPNPAGTLVGGADAGQLYALQGGVLQQYQIVAGGQLAAGGTVAPASGSTLLAAAASADGSRLYVVVTAGSGVSETTAINAEHVDASGTITSAGTAATLPSGTVRSAQLAVDRSGRVYALIQHGDFSDTLHVMRPNPDGSLTQEGSRKLSSGGTLVVQPGGAEAVVVQPGFAVDQNTHIGGIVFPLGVSTAGAVTLATTVNSGDPSNTNYDFPSGASFSLDGSALYVANELSVFNSNGPDDVSGVIAPFAVNGDGSLTAQTQTPSPPHVNGGEYDAGVVTSPSGGHLFVANDNQQSSGTIDTLATGAGGSLTPGASVASAAHMTSLLTVTPPTLPAAIGGGGGTVTTAPPPSPGQTMQLTVSISGTVTGPEHAPVAGASISACRDAGTCETTTTGAGGGYVLSGLPIGNWLIQVDPGAGDLFGASDHVSLTADRTLDFQLHPPVPLSDGVTFSTLFGTTGHGVPAINWDQPYGISVPVQVPHSAPPGSNFLFTLTAGVGSANGNQVDGGFNLAAAAVFEVHYGSDGAPAAVSQPAVGQIDCDAPAGQLSPCAILSTLGQSNTGGASAARAGEPVAHAASPCPGANGFSITPNVNGGIDINYTTADGTTHTLSIPQMAIPSPASTGNWFQDLVMNVGVGATNTVLGVFFPEVGLYNAVVGALNQIVTASQTSSTSAQALTAGSVTVSLLGAALNKATHGASYFFGNMLAGTVSAAQQSLAANSPLVQAAPVPSIDCGNQGGGGGGGGGGNYTNVGGSFTVDPSGTVQSTKHVPLYHAKVTITRATAAHGRQLVVPNNSDLFSSANRRNPDTTSLLGSFGWDVVPGFYQVDASHSGCRGTAHSPVYAVPPPRTDLTLTLTCPSLRRSGSRVRLTVRPGRGGGEQLVATVTAARARSASLIGTVTFRSGAKTLTSVLLGSHGTAIADIPPVKGLGKRTTAAYSGNGLYLPASVTVG
jgi:hypothetical protein